MVSQPLVCPRTGYPSDLTDEQWLILEPLIPKSRSNSKCGGRPSKYAKREIVNAIFYVKTTGCQWKYLPNDLPPWPIVYHYFRAWHTRGLWKKINRTLVRSLRASMGRNEYPSVGIIDSQTAKTSSIARHTGYDGGKKTVGRKRHILTDTQGFLLDVVVHPAHIQDRDGAKKLLRHARSVVGTLEKIFADGGYAGKLIDWVRTHCNTTLEIVKRNDPHRFVVLAKRWIVERTLSWLSKARRLAREYETTPQSEEGMIYVAMIHLMLRRVI